MATVGTNRGEHEETGAKSRPYAWYFTAKYDEVLDSTEMKDIFMEMLRSHAYHRMVFLPLLKIIYSIWGFLKIKIRLGQEMKMKNKLILFW